MKALSFWKAVTLDKANLLEEVFALLHDNGVRFCVIGGQAVNAYVERKRLRKPSCRQCGTRPKMARCGARKRFGRSLKDLRKAG
jgi:hypothetical protein